MHSRLNRIYYCMKSRCYSIKNNRYKYYGGRGITVCEEWLNKEHVSGTHNCNKGFQSFKSWALSNGYADNLTLDRIDVNKGYSPENCRWVDYKVQCNNSRKNLFIEYEGEVKTLAEWAEHKNIPYYLLYERIYKLKQPLEKAFSKGVKHEIQ